MAVILGRRDGAIDLQNQDKSFSQVFFGFPERFALGINPRNLFDPSEIIFPGLTEYRGKLSLSLGHVLTLARVGRKINELRKGDLPKSARDTQLHLKNPIPVRVRLSEALILLTSLFDNPYVAIF